jgi:hypothetical protein
MITLSGNLVTEYTTFVAGSVTALVPIIGITAGVFLAFTIFDRMARIILKTLRKP